MNLQRAGLLLPKEQWGKADMHSKTSRASLVAAWITAAISAVLMYAGNGQVATWIGVGGMLVFLAWFTYLSMHAIDVRDRLQQQLEEEETQATPAHDDEVDVASAQLPDDPR